MIPILSLYFNSEREKIFVKLLGNFRFKAFHGAPCFCTSIRLSELYLPGFEAGSKLSGMYNKFHIVDASEILRRRNEIVSSVYKNFNFNS